jgi:threonine dehydratase
VSFSLVNDFSCEVITGFLYFQGNAAMITFNDRTAGDFRIRSQVNAVFTLRTSNIHSNLIRFSERGHYTSSKPIWQDHMTTPQLLAPKLAELIGIANPLYLKREDLHPMGSHKGRSIPLMIKKYFNEGFREFVISSSGNAALAAIISVREHNTVNEKISLTVYIGEKIIKGKLLRLEDASNGVMEIVIKQMANPKQEAMMAEKNSNKIKNLRQSTDDSALIGYESLAQELAEIENLSAVFIPTSSGTTAQGLFEGFQKLNINPQIHIVQTTDCHPFVACHSERSEEPIVAVTPSVASAIVDQVGHRKINILKIVKETNGGGWVATNAEIFDAMSMAKQTENIDISPNSALSVAGLKKSVQCGRKFDGAVVCLITGR